MIQALSSHLGRLLYAISRINFPLCLLALVPIIGEVHHFWANDMRQTDVFLFIDYSLWNEWIVSQVCGMIQYSIVTYVLFYFSKRVPISKDFRKIFMALFIQSLMDIVMYFLTCRASGYGIVFYILALFLVFTIKLPKEGTKIAVKL